MTHEQDWRKRTIERAEWWAMMADRLRSTRPHGPFWAIRKSQDRVAELMRQAQEGGE